MKFDISSMLNPDIYKQPVGTIELIETHISWIILTGKFAYKIKKPVNFGFLDFSTLEKRHEFCELELRLNQRLAPDLYLDVVTISGSMDRPILSANHDVIEYAVKMKQFAQSAQLDNMLAAGKLKISHMARIAKMVADFHQTIPRVDDSMEYGSKKCISDPVYENFNQINKYLDTGPYDKTLEHLRQWSQSELTRLSTIFEQRKKNGFVRECHGDMHLRNLVWLDDAPVAFDCIEFNPGFRWIDVISEIAFLYMDLLGRKEDELGHCYLNTYLEITGDYAGLSVFPYYRCYRALVRAKVDAIRMGQKNLSEKEQKKSLHEFETYLALANRFTKQSKPRLIIMRGFSASGKSTISQHLIEQLGAVRIRSDVERKRYFAHTDNTSTGIESGMYSKHVSQQTYTKLYELASSIINAGFSVVVDAAFLKYKQRKAFHDLASLLEVTYLILEVTAPPDILRQRIVAREQDISDADLDVLEHQLKTTKPLDKNELENMVLVDTSEAFNINSLINALQFKS